MGRYLLLWDIERTRVPLDPKERGAGFNMLLEMVKQDIKKGLTKDWGVFIGEHTGYSVVEGSEVEVMKQIHSTPHMSISRFTPLAQ